MKLRKMIMTGILTAALSASAVYAGETTQEAPDGLGSILSGVLDSVQENSDELKQALFGEDGPLKDVLPEGTDIDSMIDTARQQLEQADGEISELVDTIAGAIESEVGNIDTDTIKQYAGELVSQLMGGGDIDLSSLGDIDFSSFDEMIAVFDSLKASEKAYMLEHNAEALEPGDVQIVSGYNISQDEYDADPIRSFNYMIQCDYTVDEENQLRFLCGAEDVVLFSHRKDENGDYPVTDASFSEDGENYTASVEAMCSEMGITADTCMEEIEAAKVMFIYDLKMYMDEHPDVAGIEFEGEIRSAEDLYALWSERISELYPVTEEMTTEAALEG